MRLVCVLCYLQIKGEKLTNTWHGLTTETAYLVLLASRQALAEQVLVLLIVNLQHACLHPHSTVRPQNHYSLLM